MWDIKDTLIYVMYSIFDYKNSPRQQSKNVFCLEMEEGNKNQKFAEKETWWIVWVYEYNQAKEFDQEFQEVSTGALMDGGWCSQGVAIWENSWRRSMVVQNSGGSFLLADQEIQARSWKQHKNFLLDLARNF